MTSPGAMRRGFGLAVTSVPPDAGAGDVWRYRDPETGTTMARSEGLAAGMFSGDRSRS